MYKSESTQEKEIHKIPFDFEKQTDHLIVARRPNLVKKHWNIMVTMIAVVIGVIETVPKVVKSRPEKLEIRGRINTILTTALLRSASILR